MRSRSLVAFCLLLVLPCFSLSAIEVDISDWTTLKSILATLKTDNAQLQTLLAESQTQLTEARTQLEKAQQESVMLRKSLDEMKSSLDKLKISLQNTSDQQLFGLLVTGTLTLAVGILVGSLTGH